MARQMSLTQWAEDVLDSFCSVGGTLAMYRGEPCRTLSQAEYLGAVKAFQRVLYEMGRSSLLMRDGIAYHTDFAERDREYAEYAE